MIVLVSLLLCLLPAAIGQVPDAPQPKVPVLDKILLGGVVAVRSADAYTTHQFLRLGIREANMPESVVCHQPVSWTYSLGVAALQMEASRVRNDK